MHVLAVALVTSAVAGGVSIAQTQHQNGLGQTYSDAAPLGSPGNQSSYTQVMAQEAANSWPQTGTASSAVCKFLGTHRWSRRKPRPLVPHGHTPVQLLVTFT